MSSDRSQALHLYQNFESSFDDWIDTVPWLDPNLVDWISDGSYLFGRQPVTNIAALQTFWDDIIGADKL